MQRRGELGWIIDMEVAFLREKCGSLREAKKRDPGVSSERGMSIVQSWLYVRDEDERRVQRRETAEGNIWELLLCGRSPP